MNPVQKKAVATAAALRKEALAAAVAAALRKAAVAVEVSIAAVAAVAASRKVATAAASIEAAAVVVTETAINPKYCHETKILHTAGFFCLKECCLHEIIKTHAATDWR